MGGRKVVVDVLQNQETLLTDVTSVVQYPYIWQMGTENGPESEHSRVEAVPEKNMLRTEIMVWCMYWTGAMIYTSSKE